MCNPTLDIRLKYFFCTQCRDQSITPLRLAACTFTVLAAATTRARLSMHFNKRLRYLCRTSKKDKKKDAAANEQPAGAGCRTTQPPRTVFNVLSGNNYSRFCFSIIFGTIRAGFGIRDNSLDFGTVPNSLGRLVTLITLLPDITCANTYNLYLCI